MAQWRVLILDDAQIRSIIKEHSWSDYVDDDEDIDLFIFTSQGAVSEKDKTSPRIRDFHEVPHPTTDGTLELWAVDMHRKHSLTHIYTKNEDLIIRAAHLRSLLNIKTGLSADQVPAYREKVLMKEIASKGGFPVPPFARLLAPADLIGFIEKHGYPVVIKPTLGCAVAGLHLISNDDELWTFLESKLFTCIDITQRMDLVGELIVEGYMSGRMFHVDGLAINGQIVRVWPFAYLHTCFDFAQHGSAYGNSSIPHTDPLYSRLHLAAQRLLDILPTPSDCLIFHLELYENVDKHKPDDDFVLCEIAARAPGGSITALIDLLSFTGDNESFARLDFRASVSLSIPSLNVEKKQEGEEKVVTDLIIPRKPGKLMFMPPTCPIPNLTYIPLVDADTATIYKEYDCNAMNSVCRFIATTNTMDEGRELVEKGYEWFNNSCIVTPTAEPCSLPLVKELHRFVHQKIFV